MSKIEEIFRNEAEIQIAKESHDYEAEVEYKPFTVRIAAPTLSALDNLAKSLRKTRNEIASDLITAGLEDAVRGYSSVFSDPQQTYEQIMTGCVPDIEWGLPPKSEGTK
jgi:hypothetical protein